MTSPLTNLGSQRTKQNRADAAADTDGLNHSNSSGQQKNSSRLIRETGDNTFKFKLGRKSRRKRPDRVIHAHPHPHSSDSEIDSLQTKIIGDSVHRLSSAIHTGFTVQICQHSSFERDQYIQYQSSLSTQGVVPSLSLRRASGLGESSPCSIFNTESTDQNVIVPDSQSLANSSSYLPSTSASEVTSSNESAQDIALFHSSRVADYCEIDSFNLREYEATQTGNAPSSSVVSASESLVTFSQRSISAPPLSSSVVSGNLSSRRAAIPHPSRSESVPSFVIPESVSQVSLSRLVQTSTQGDDSFSRTKGPGKNTQHSSSSEKLGGSSPYLDFQTQVSIVLDCQSTQVSTDFVGKYICHLVQYFDCYYWQF